MGIFNHLSTMIRMVQVLEILSHGPTRIILCMCPANERWHYISVMSSLIGWLHTQNDPWTCWCHTVNLAAAVISSLGNEFIFLEYSGFNTRHFLRPRTSAISYHILSNRVCQNHFSFGSCYIITWYCIQLFICKFWSRRRPTPSYPCVSGKLWYLQHNCVGDTIVYHWYSQRYVSYGMSTVSSLVKLTLNLLNCFKGYKICIHILYHTLDFVQQKKTKFTIEQPYMLPILWSQYHAGCCPGDLRSQGISRHGIDPKSRNIRLQHQKS